MQVVQFYVVHIKELHLRICSSMVLIFSMDTTDPELRMWIREGVRWGHDCRNVPCVSRGVSHPQNCCPIFCSLDSIKSPLSPYFCRRTRVWCRHCGYALCRPAYILYLCGWMQRRAMESSTTNGSSDRQPWPHMYRSIPMPSMWTCTRM